MEIKEVEKILSVSRSNIRFYEKEGLICPERRGNNYREYSDGDVEMLRKIIVLRKLGFSVEEISAMQNGGLELTQAISENTARLEAEIERLNGALEMSRTIAEENTTFDALDGERYMRAVSQAEGSGKSFADISRDYLMFELGVFDDMWKYVFLYDFKGSRKRHGVAAACALLFIICLVRGVARVVFWHDSFLDGFLYPIIIFAAGSLILLPIYILSKKAPRAAAVISKILLAALIVFLAAVVIFAVIMAVSSLFS